ncbi:hypothetical protein C1E_0231330 [Pseudomonas amygdali pv. tabaci str. ATCC 11528]|nr:hypothetical protein C1E_0231330 [Pseudomonas amygdali pv. tabaci str. ATCC 11528]
MSAKAFGDQRHTDHDQEAQGQHDHRRVIVDELRQRVSSNKHHDDGSNYSNDHNRQVFGHAHGSDDTVDREHQIQHQDLHDGRAHAQCHDRTQGFLFFGLDVHAVVNFRRRFPDQEQATSDQNHVLPRERLAEHLEYRLCQLHDVRHGAEQAKAHHQRHTDTQFAGLFSLVLRELVGDDRDEDQVIDTQYDFHDHQCCQRDPGCRTCCEFQ